MSKKVFTDKYILKRRMIIILGIFSVLAIVLIYYMIRVMIINGEYYKNLATKQWTSRVKIDAKRGTILDRNGNELAVSGNVYRVDLDLNAIRADLREEKYTLEVLADDLGKVLSISKESVLKTMTQKGPDGKNIGYAILKRRIEPSVADSVKEVIQRYAASGILVSPDTKRYYTNGVFASQVIGHTNSDGVGLTGVELYYNKYLAGEPGIILEEKDLLKKEVPYNISKYVAPVEGNDVVLTIDSKIQAFAEKYAKEAQNDNSAKAVSIIVMDPNNGEILAMANTPCYDPNSPWIEGMSFEELQKSWRNRAVSDAYEPGSIFKVITAMGALEENLISSGDQFIANCSGSFEVGGRIIHCWKRTGHGSETFVDILKDSCNTGFSKIGAELGPEKLYKYIKQANFGNKTGIDLPGESAGIVRPANKMTTVDVATISFGQANTASMIQYMAAFNSVANGGTFITPHVLKEIKTPGQDNPQVVKTFDSGVNKRVFSKEKTQELRGYLEQVVSEGGAKKSYIAGQHIGGKTGTAQIPQPGGGYATGKYLASFAGMAPADNPKVTVMIQILEPDPSNYYAGQIAAPVAQKLFNDIFNYLDIKSDASDEEVEQSLKNNVIVPEIRGLEKEEAIKILKKNNLTYDIEDKGNVVSDITPKPGYTMKEGDKVILYTGDSSTYNKVVVVPDFDGLSKEKATELLNSLGIKGTFEGKGLVVEQSIDPGKEINIGGTINFKLEDIID
ncbi:stage V sporulation protein D [Clostridium cellulovorans]|uniref:Stage V sporulation protein D n=1 Tax=Clostridium cellulovorans (strain ATCC 35296 / DSM 3052 / OCM 3 / 743B) TaxID=573061 RepID=D9SKJ8_CLOC7|nr:stage V sporulation protein D [Clostridium cellulovorans]ADL51494.1 stage V sporulation protein D [Clostridium cellulovorans 743B]